MPDEVAAWNSAAEPGERDWKYEVWPRRGGLPMITSSKRRANRLTGVVLALAAVIGGLCLGTPKKTSRIPQGIPRTPNSLSSPPKTDEGRTAPGASSTSKRINSRSPVASSPGGMPDSATSAHLKESYAALPILFEANQGQTDERVKFLSRGAGYNLFLTQSGVVLSLADPDHSSPSIAKSTSGTPSPRPQRAFAVALRFAGAAEQPVVVGDELLQSKSNYILGNDSAQWRRGVPNFGKVQYRGLYPGIDAVFHGESQRLEFDFDVAPGANPKSIALQVYGARPVRIPRTGDVALRINRDREVVLGKPLVYQEISGQRHAIAAKFVLRGQNRIGFSLGPYDRSAPLIIDPTLVYSTYFGPTQGSYSSLGLSNPINGVAVDASGYAYVVGTTTSLYLPIVPAFSIGGLYPIQYQASGPYEPFCQECSAALFYTTESIAFVAKFDTTKSGANSLIYSTYLGPMFYPLFNPNPPSTTGSLPYYPPGWAAGSAIAVDPNGNAYVTGTVFALASGGAHFPTTPGAVQQGNAGTTDGFISVLDPTGQQLLASTYLGGANDANTNGGGTGDHITAITLDASDNVYVTGVTDSFRMSTPCAYQPFSGGPDTLFVAKLNSSLTQLQYYTYLFGSGGYVSTVGSGADTAKAIAVNSAGEVFVVGGAYPRTPIPGNGSVTGIPGPPIPVNPGCGYPYPNPLPANVGFQTSLGTGTYGNYGTESETGFLAKFNASGTQLLYLTYLGGNLSSSQGYGSEMDAVALDPNGNAYVAGNTYETNLPVTAGVVGPNAGCTMNAYNQTICSQNFLTEINPGVGGQSSLTFLTYLPQTSQTGTATGVALDQFGDILVTGATNLNVTAQNVPNMPNPNGTAGSASTAQLGDGESMATYLLELNPGATKIIDSGYLGGDLICPGPCFGVEDFPANMALDTAGNVYLAGQVASTDFPTTTSAFQSARLAANSNPNGFLAKISMGAANQPQLAVNPPVGNFGIVPAGLSPQITLTVSDSGQAPLLIQNVTTTGPFTLLSNTINCNGSPSGTFVGSLSPGSSCTANVMFNSSQAGPFTGALVFVDNSPQGTPDPNTPGYNDQSFVLTAIAPATHFGSTAPTSVIAGMAFNLTLAALNASDTTATAYTGTVHFTSTDGLAILPTDYTFTAGDNGSHVFTVTTLNTLGSQTISAADTSITSINGTTNAITVNPPPATYFVVSAPSIATTGLGFSFTVTAMTASNTTATSYAGTAHFTSTDSQAGLPSDYTFTAADNGTHVFSATLNTAGTQSITATDTATSTITGASNLIAVTPPPPPPTLQILVNEPITVTDAVSLPDVPDTEAINVHDTVFISPLINVAVPAVSFSAGAVGFNGQSGSQSITVSDIGQAPLTLSSATISGGTQFTIVQISCSNGAGSVPTVLAPGAACNLTIGYTASTTPASDTAALVFADNAALSNLASTPAGSSFTQSISLNGTGSNTLPPPPPPAIIPIVDNEVISVTDAPSFPDVFDAEKITVTDQVTVTVLNTSVGAGVIVSPVDTTTSASPVTLNFSQVTQPGTTSLTITSAGPAAPSGFQLGNPGVYYNISSTATFTGSVAICINYAGISFTQAPKLFHYQNGAWVNVTTSVNNTTMVVCGTTTSFSPFALFQQSTFPTTTSISAAGVTYGTPASVSVSVASSSGPVTGSVSLSVDGGIPSTMTLSSGSASFSLGGLSAGSHSLSANFAAQGKFLASSASGTVSVAQAPSTITANNATRLYGTANSVFSASYAGFVNGDTTSVLGGTLSCSTTATPASPVGTYPITCSGQSGANYSIAYLPGQLTVNKATLTITANNLSKNFDAPNPTLTWTATGFVNGDTTSVLTTIPTCTTTATKTSPVGSYPITCSGAAATNYTFSYVSGTLTVVCHYVSIGVSPSTVAEGGLITVRWTLKSCSNSTQTVAFTFNLSGPAQPNTCSASKSKMFSTPPFALKPNTLESLSFPFRIPKGICLGTYSTTATTTINGKAVDATSISLTITSP